MNTLSKILLLVLLATCHEEEVLITINADSEQKNSETQGNFDGELTINSEFGSAIAVIGDLKSDNVGDLVVGSPHQNNRGAVQIIFMDKDGITDLAAGSPGFNDGGLDRGAICILYLDTDDSVAGKKKISASQSDISLPVNDGITLVK